MARPGVSRPRRSGVLAKGATSTIQTRTELWSSAFVSIDDFDCQTAPHRHAMEEVSPDHCVVFVRSGAFLRTIGTQSVLADPTRVLFFTRAQPYRVSHPIAGGDRCTIVTVPAETLLEIGRRHDPGWSDDPDAPFGSRHALATARAALLHQALLGGLRRGELGPLAVHELALDLLDEVLGSAAAGRAANCGPSSTATPGARELAEAAKTVVAGRYATPPSLEGLAETLGCSPFHLCRSFSRVVGLPLRRYLDRLRLRLALERLGDGEPNLTTLALELGYADHSHFTNAFRREFGHPPSALRPSMSRRGSARGVARDRGGVPRGGPTARAVSARGAA
jgi:AraC family transcriptional regulator